MTSCHSLSDREKCDVYMMETNQGVAMNVAPVSDTAPVSSVSVEDAVKDFLDELNQTMPDVPQEVRDNLAREFGEELQDMITPPTEEELAASKHRVSLARARLTEYAPFFGHLALKMRIFIAEPGHFVPTAAVTPDGKLFVNHKFMKKLSDAELAGLLCHEVMHPALACFERKGARQMKLWNVAHDHAINLIIDEMTANDNRVKLPPGGLLDKKYSNMSAEEIYEQLKQDQPEGPGEGEGEGEGPGGMGGGTPGHGQGHGTGSDIRTDLADNRHPSPQDQADQNSKWRSALVEAAMKHRQRGKGNLPAGLQKLVDEITDPKVDWPTTLARWVGENGKRGDFTYSRPSRRSEEVGEYLPSMKKYGVADVTVLWDTSGSMTGREHEILSEVVGICNDLGMKLRIICCDYGICSDQTDVGSAEEIDVRGGGGSNFIPAFDRLTEEGWDGVVVCFTDGYIDVPHLQPDGLRGVLWVINEGDIDPTQGRYGSILRIDKDGNVINER